MRDVEAAADLFVRTAAGLSEEQLRSPSLLPGWSRAHVVAHVVLNAEGFVAVAETPADRQPALMYPGGIAERDRDIAALAAASADELLQRCRNANRLFTLAWSPGPLSRDCATAAGHPVFASGSVLQRRLRELQVHLIDLGVDGVGIDAWLPEFVDADLDLQWPTVAHRTSQRVAVDDEDGVRWETEPAPPQQPALVVPRRLLLAWVLDRAVIDGLPSLDSWSNRSKWEWTDRDA